MNGLPVWFAACAALAVMSCGASDMPPSVARSVALGTAPTQVVITAPAEVIAAGRRGGPARLVFSGLRTDVQPGVLYRVQLGGRNGTVLGYINFFNVATGGETAFDLDVGRALATAGPGPTYVLVLTPEGQADPAAHPVVGAVDLIAGSHFPCAAQKLC